LQLVAVEEAFKNLKGDLAIRPIFHQLERRIEAHILALKLPAQPPPKITASQFSATAL
jgi:hypothetical protein